VTFETIEESHILTQCNITSQITDLILKAVDQGEKAEPNNNGFMVEDETELQVISLSLINDHPAPDDVMLPNVMTILALN
jgi:hypothetical protein